VGRRTANFSDKGFSIAAGSTPGSQKGSAASFSMKVKLIASEKPAAVRIWRTRRVRAISGSGGACGAVSGGNVTGTRSNP
jgi:hypothetical protein